MKRGLKVRRKNLPTAAVSVLVFICGFIPGTASAHGLGLSWSTFIGGSDWDAGIAVAVDSAGCAYVSGATLAAGFPTTSGAFDGSYNDKFDTFVAKFNLSATDLIYSTFLGGAYDDYGNDIAVDTSGSVYVVGETRSQFFPITSGAYDGLYGWGTDAFVTKLSPSGDYLVYSTFLGGSDGDYADSVTLDSDGATYITGTTSSANFPTTSGAFAEDIAGASDVFVSKLNPSGANLVYSTFLGGSDDDFGCGIVIDSANAVYVTGETYSQDFPTVSGIYDDSYNLNGDAFVSKLSVLGSDLVYSTFLGGNGADKAEDVAVDSSGCAYVTGGTDSPDFPATSGACGETHNGGKDVFIGRINPAGTTLEYSGFLGGGSDDRGIGIAVDQSGSAFVTGETRSVDFFVTSGAYDDSYNSNGDAFVSKLNPAGSNFDYSTFMGGVNNERCRGITLDSSGFLYVIGGTRSSDFPVTSGVYDESHNGDHDAWVVKFKPLFDLTGTVTFSYPGWQEDTAEVGYQVRAPGIPPAAPLYESTMDITMTPGNPAVGSFTITGIPTGTYDVALKHGNHIADMIPGVVVSGADVTGLGFSLWAGDADGDDNPATAYPDDAGGDNDVELNDYYTLFYQYQGGVPVTTGYNSDFDADGDIDLADYYGLFYGYQNAAAPGNWY